MLTYTDLYNHILAVLYVLKIKNSSSFFSLAQIIKYLNTSTATEAFDSINDIQSIAKYLEAEGYISTNNDFVIGDMFASITTQGIIYLMNENMSLINDFLQKNELSKISEVVEILSEAAILKSKKKLINEINKQIGRLQLSKVTKNSDIVIDAKILKLELEKTTPDKEILLTKLNNIDTLPLFKNQINELRSYLLANTSQY